MNIDREFIKWFYEEHYPEMGSNRRQCYGMTAGTTNIDVIDYWMREAFRAGAQATANDTLNTLGDYACATSGLEAESITPDTVFERAQINLKEYYEIGLLSEQQAFDKQRNYPL